MTKAEKYVAMYPLIGPAKQKVDEKQSAYETLKKLADEKRADFQKAEEELKTATDNYDRQVADNSWKHPDDDTGEFAQSQYLSYQQDCDAAKAIVDNKQAVWETAKAAAEEAEKNAGDAKAELDEVEAKLQELMDEVNKE